MNRFDKSELPSRHATEGPERAPSPESYDCPRNRRAYHAYSVAVEPRRPDNEALRSQRSGRPLVETRAGVSGSRGAGESGSRSGLPPQTPEDPAREWEEADLPPERERSPGRIPRGRGGSGAYKGKVAARETGVKGFSWTSGILDALEASLSRERLRTYFEEARGDRERAMRLYGWNTAIGAAFYGPLQGLEVALRNAMHRQLANVYDPAWYDNPDAGLDKGALERVAKAKTELARAGHAVEAPRMAGALSFGFWVSLMGPGGRTATGIKANYEMTLWRPALRRAFPHRGKLTRKQVHGPLNDLRILRNRIAHHEPIFERDLAADYRRILDAEGWISPETAAWIAHHSRVPDLLDLSRDTEEIRF